MSTAPKVQRVGPGAYRVEHDGKKFELIRTSAGGRNRPTFWTLKQEVVAGQGFHLLVGCETSKRSALTCLADGVYASQIL